MKASIPVQEAAYQESRNALNWPFVACGLFGLVAGAVFLALSVTVNSAWSGAIGGLLALLMIYVSLLYRNWPTGIRIEPTAISIGAVGSARATRRSPTVNHQAWGLFTCPWSAVEDARVVTDPTVIRHLKRSSRYYTLTNRWGTTRTMTHCNTGVLISPFMRAALILDLDPTAVTATPVRPARFYSNFKDGRFSRLVPAQMSSTWIVPTRDPDGLRKALESHRRGAGFS